MSSTCIEKNFSAQRVGVIIVVLYSRVRKMIDRGKVDEVIPFEGVICTMLYSQREG